MTTPILSLAAMKSALDVRLTMTTYDARITRMVRSVTRSFETQCRRPFARQAHVELFNSRDNADATYDFAGDGDSGVRLSVTPASYILPCDPIDAAVPIEVRYDRHGRFGDDTILPSDRYTFDIATGHLIVRTPMRAAPAALQVSYTAGYPVDPDTEALAADSVPDDLALACEMQVIHLWNIWRSSLNGNDKDSKSDASTPGNAAGAVLLPEVKSMILPFRRLLTGAG